MFLRSELDSDGPVKWQKTILDLGIDTIKLYMKLEVLYDLLRFFGWKRKKAGQRWVIGRIKQIKHFQHIKHFNQI